MKTPYTPMMMQYLTIKEKHPDTLILFRLGDFYEFFFDDAKIASKELQLVLTGKSAGSKQKVPMCGVPHHAIKSYIAKLVNRGYKVGVVEQLEDPALAKGIVDRDVIQIITPGAFIDVHGSDNNYICAIEDTGIYYVLVYADITTGELAVANIEHDLFSLQSELEQLQTKEIVVSSGFDEVLLSSLLEGRRLLISREDDESVPLDYEALLVTINDGFQMKAIARLLHYLEKTQKRALTYLKAAVLFKASATLKIDSFSAANLELLSSLRNKEKYGSLLWLLDDTKTAMGTRKLKQWITHPSADLKLITKRQDMISALINSFIVKDELEKLLADIYDLERLIARIGYGNAHGRDLLQLKQSLGKLPSMKLALAKIDEENFKLLTDKFETMDDTFALLEQALDEDAPLSIKEGGIFKRGYHQELDELIDLGRGGQAWIGNLELQEREKTGIKNLKVGYNKVFGYYIEISQGNLQYVKSEFGYERKQTLTTSERFITPELKEKEAAILHAEERRQALEYELFLALRAQIANETAVIQNLADQIGEIDALLSLATLSSKNGYVRPTFNNDRLINIVKGRHPVIEKVMKVNRYVANDIEFNKDTDILLITGPNMGGKSTYMRQLALIVILAQLGCYVPAMSANLMVFDQIFTRIGASDDLVSGQSTFMVEMNESNYALQHASSNSLLLFDEIGRGTATYDGMALAQAIMEYIAVKIRAKTIFSTHYHELTTLEAKLPNLKNIQVLVAEEKDKVTFLYQVASGAMNKSYGINVARLAHLPPSLLDRAKEILKSLEKNGRPTSNKVMEAEEPINNPWVEELASLDPLTMTPMDALRFLYDFKKKMK
ncbi:MAG TPA: DNA mismatch repair protein MutS [Firmicutes bacterium]|nr:DNA mismatch repair protein MutS [Bacillota bacterium]